MYLSMQCLSFIFHFLLVPEEFNFDPVSKTYGEPQRRPEIKSATIEFIAPSEYMVRHGIHTIKFILHLHTCTYT